MGKNLTKTTLVEKYLNGEEGRKVALAYATAVLKTDYEQIPYRLKQAIKSYVAKDREDFISCIKVNSIYKFYDNISKFPLNEIRYLPPHYIQANDYKEIQACIKNPIDVKRCSFEGVTADLSLIKQGYFDKYFDQSEVTKSHEIGIKYYVSPKKDMTFAKTVEVNYFPKNLKLADQKSKGKLNLFERNFSETMYILLDGDPQKPMPYMRYDNEAYDIAHTNLYVGVDERSDIYSASATGPHFHFLNETDSLLCLKKFNKSRNPYTANRSNAIDCAMLHNYLVNLDRNQKMGSSYDMPFLAFKKANRKIKINLNEIISNCLEKLQATDFHIWEDFKNSRYYQPNDYANRNDKCFTELVLAIDFIQFVAARQRACSNTNEFKILSNLEIATVDNVMNEINMINRKAESYNNEEFEKN